MDGNDPDLKLRLEKWMTVQESLRLLDEYEDLDSFFKAESPSNFDSKTDSSKSEIGTVRSQSFYPASIQYDGDTSLDVDLATEDEYKLNNEKQVWPLKSLSISGDLVRDSCRSVDTKPVVSKQCNTAPSNQPDISTGKNGINCNSSLDPANLHYEDNFCIYTDPATKYEYAWSDKKLKWLPKSSLIPSIVIQEIGALVNYNSAEIETSNSSLNSDKIKTLQAFCDEGAVCVSNVPPATENEYVWSKENQKWESKSLVTPIDTVQNDTIPVNTNSFASETNGNTSPNTVNECKTDVIIPNVAAPMINYACVWNNGNQYLLPNSSLPTVAIVQDSFLPVNTYSAVSEINSNSSPNLVNLQCANNVAIANTSSAMNYTYVLRNENQYSVPNNFLTSVAVVQNSAMPVNVNSAGIEIKSSPSLNSTSLQFESDKVGRDIAPAVKYDCAWTNENQAWVTQSSLNSNITIRDFNTPLKTVPEQYPQCATEPVRLDSAYDSKLTEVCQPLQSSTKFNSNSNVTTEPAVFFCFHCPRQFKTKSHLQEHLLAHADGRCFPCVHCPAQFKVKAALKKHLISHSEERAFACNLCPARFKKKQILDEHLPSHSDERPVSCQKCSARFKTQSTLRHHMRTHSSIVYSCNQCGATFKAKTSLSKHLDKHSHRKLFDCYKCPAHFRLKGDLVAHMSSHNELFFYCFKCHSPFKSNCQLKSHSAIHTGRKPLSCCHCDTKFDKKYELKQHLLEHADVKTFSCNLCYRPFKMKSQLERHISFQYNGKSIFYG